MSINICGLILEIAHEENVNLFPELAERLAREAQSATPLRFLPQTAKRSILRASLTEVCHGWSN